MLNLSDQKQYKDILYKAFKKQLDSSIKEVKDNGGKASMSLKEMSLKLKYQPKLVKCQEFYQLMKIIIMTSMKKSLEKAGYSCN